VNGHAFSVHACQAAEKPGLPLYATGLLVLTYVKKCEQATSTSSGLPITSATPEYNGARVNIVHASKNHGVTISPIDQTCLKYHLRSAGQIPTAGEYALIRDCVTY
jgi:hypothetical protein